MYAALIAELIAIAIGLIVHSGINHCFRVELQVGALVEIERAGSPVLPLNGVGGCRIPMLCYKLLRLAISGAALPASRANGGLDRISVCAKLVL